MSSNILHKAKEDKIELSNVINDTLGFKSSAKDDVDLNVPILLFYAQL